MKTRGRVVELVTAMEWDVVHCSFDVYEDRTRYACCPVRDHCLRVSLVACHRVQSIEGRRPQGSTLNAAAPPAYTATPRL